MRYKEVARQFGITQVCPWCGYDLERAHERGYVTFETKTVHWSRVRVTHAGLRRFLMLIVSLKRHHNRGQPQWQVIYEQNVDAVRAGQTLHRRFPRSLSAPDRARVRWLIEGQHDIPPAVRRWAYRSQGEQS